MLKMLMYCFVAADGPNGDGCVIRLVSTQQRPDCYILVWISIQGDKNKLVALIQMNLLSNSAEF